VSEQINPDERFDQVESTLNQLSNSLKHLLTAQVLMNERLERAETAIQRLAEENVKLAEKTNVVAEKVDVLIDIVRKWYERHGNGSGGATS
jgi:hypothetical protein